MANSYVRMPGSIPCSDPLVSPQSSFIVETPNTGLPPTLSFWFPFLPRPRHYIGDITVFLEVFKASFRTFSRRLTLRWNQTGE